ncbi:MAG: 23S rRNA (uracil(1939)-C(5))-methyltransferase RlmD [Oscillospiraceae bacterium]|nr:23S rRNA (uracil(1939)-C(5))-methyltransferase RlmD [Oscillospiraceae bacterium]
MEQFTLKKNACYQAEILSVTGEGFGICRINGMVVFVPQTLTGELCDVKIVKVLSRYAYGIATLFHRTSPERIQPECPVYRQCGGCCFRHLSYREELRIKEAMVQEAFKRIGGISFPPEPILGSERISGYRNKAQYPVGSDGKSIIYGFYANRSHRIIPCQDCALQPPVFSDIARYTADQMQRLGVLPYSEKTGRGELRHLYLRMGEATGEIMLCFVASHDISKKLCSLIPELVEHFPKIKSIVLNLNLRRDNVILGKDCKTLWGKDTISDILCGLQFHISPLSFYQVNRLQAERLYQLAREYASLGGSETVIDLYCGVGTIGLSMAGQCRRLIGVEIVPEAVENAKENAVRNGITNAEFICADAKAAVKELEKRGTRPDVVLLDPPRKGCDSAVIDDVTTMQPGKIVMISCNPSTAARDCRLFEERGYRVSRYRAVDLFPRTGHVETVVLMSRVEGK